VRLVDSGLGDHLIGDLWVELRLAGSQQLAEPTLRVQLSGFTQPATLALFPGMKRILLSLALLAAHLARVTRLN
jgi:hypothetical protein